MLAALDEHALSGPGGDDVDVAVVAVSAAAIDETALSRVAAEIPRKDGAVVVVEAAAQEFQVAGLAVDVDADLVAVRLDVDPEAGGVAAMRARIAISAEIAVDRRQAQDMR